MSLMVGGISGLCSQAVTLLFSAKIRLQPEKSAANYTTKLIANLSTNGNLLTS